MTEFEKPSFRAQLKILVLIISSIVTWEGKQKLALNFL